LFVLLQVPEGAPAAANRFEDARCGVALTLPTGWRAAKVEAPFDATECAFGLRPADWLARRKRRHCDTPEWAIYLSVYRGRLDGRARMLVEQDGALMFAGRGGMNYPAEISQHPAGRVARGMSETGCYEPGGGPYVGSAQVDVAIVESGRRMFELVATSSKLPSKQFDQIVRSFRAAGPPRPRSPAP
jgi:hypothetical protein